MKPNFPIALTALTAIAGGATLLQERQTSQALGRLAGAALETLLNAIEANDPVTGMHVRRVAAYALIIADAVGLEEHQQRAVERVALFHDEGVLSHHERWNGTGYPRRLRGPRIPIEARIVSIADTFDAVAHSRRYRTGTGPEAALQVLFEGRGTQFDPQLIDLIMLPPVQSAIAKESVASHRRHGEPDSRRYHRREGAHAPDVSFRWRSESLGSSRILTSKHVD
jgi:HD-GYP domain-containing protein (c-di-GMP phosphodiesterase class II)